ncbi:MAG TPA: hypothetical protein VKS79_16550 [Gemmataceae bacterium]|nr:hypothetical protein [Gemmataceae bacterium]
MIAPTSFRCWSGMVPLLVLAIHSPGLFAQQIHRNDLGGGQIYFLRGPGNVRYQEAGHQVSTEYAHAETSSEFLVLDTEASTQAGPQLFYLYPTPRAPVTEDLQASIWLKAKKPGIQICVRVVLPRMRNPEAGKGDQAFTTIVEGETYNNTDSWQRLELSHVPRLLREKQQLLRAQLGRDVDIADAFVDQLLLNLYAGPGRLHVWLNQVDIGPVAEDRPVVAGMSPQALNVRPSRGGPVELQRDQLMVGGKRFFFRAVRHSDTALEIWKRCGFNTLVLESGASSRVIDDALRLAAGPPIAPFRQELYLVPTLPVVSLDTAPATLVSNQPSNPSFSSDRILFSYLGGGRPAEAVDPVVQTAQFTRETDPQRLLAIDAWDGLWPYSRNIDLLGIHRWPLVTSLELTKYRDWLVQRRLLARPGAFTWTWVQTHWTDEYTQLAFNKPAEAVFEEPIGPQPEQIRLLTYIALCSGCRGIGYWSDHFLADTHHGQERLLEVALLNLEMQMLEPALLAQIKSPFWIDTSHPHVKAAVLFTDKGLLVIPIWLGGGAQYVSGQSATKSLSITIPQVPLTSEPWEVRPGIVRSINNPKRVPGGVQITIPEFDLCTAVVFTGDNNKDGLLVWWQDQCRQTAPAAADWTIQLARAELAKIQPVEEQLQKIAPALKDTDNLLGDAAHRIQRAQEYLDGKDYRNAYLEGQRALRPLRHLMRLRFDQAVDAMQPPPEKPKEEEIRHPPKPKNPEPARAPAKAAGPDAGRPAPKPGSPEPNKPPPKPETRILRHPAASPYAVSFWTLPKHWPFWDEIKNLKTGANVLSSGTFEGDPAAGWTKKEDSLDFVVMQARYSTVTPKEGNQCIELNISPKSDPAKPDQPPKVPGALERTCLAVRSPTVKLQPGSLVKISGWVKIPRTLLASADGALAYDNIGGDALGLRITDACEWKQFELYRRVPASGEVFVVLALTGLGTVQFDDIRIEPLVPK